MNKITYTGKHMSYIDAFNYAKDKGGLPTNADLDDTLVGSDAWKPLSAEGYFGKFLSPWPYGAWARECIAYPKKDGVFEREDITDNFYNFRLEKRFVPKDAFEYSGIALVIEPKEITKTLITIRIIPKKITLLPNFPKEDGWYGFDKETRVPVNEEPKTDYYGSKRYLWRRNSQTLRPLVRWDYGWYGYYRRYVDAVYRPDVLRGVGVVSSSIAANKATKQQRPVRKVYEM